MIPLEEYEERMEFTDIYHHIKDSYNMQITILSQFNQMTQEQFELKTKEIQYQIVMNFRPQIARLGELYRKYNMAQYYEQGTENV